MRIDSKLILIFFFYLSITSCKKDDDPKDGVSDHVFKIEAEIGGFSSELIAGESDYYMHTGFEKDSGSIFCFKGTLGHKDCENNDPNTCSRSLSIIIRDNKTANSDASNINESLQINDYNYRTPIQPTLTGYEVQFTPDIWGNGNYSYYWEFGDGHTSTESNPIHTYSASIPDPWVNACLVITNLNNNNKDTLCNEINLASDCYTNFNYVSTAGSPNTVSFNTITFTENGNNLNLNAVWRKDPATNFSSSISPTFPSSTPIRVCMTDSGNACDNVKCKNIIPDSTYTDVANFDFSKNNQYDYTSSDFSQVTIIWYDENGNKYTSNKEAQPTGSVFRVTSVSDYKKNRNGESTKKVGVEFTCTLYSENSNNTIEINNATGTFAIAHP